MLRTIRDFRRLIVAHKNRDPFSAGMRLIARTYTTEIPVEELPGAFIALAQRPPLVGSQYLRAPGRAGIVITVPGLENTQPISRRTELYFCDKDDIRDLPPWAPNRERYSREGNELDRPKSRRRELVLCGDDAPLEDSDLEGLRPRFTWQLFANIVANAFAYTPGLLYSRDDAAKLAVWNAILRLKRGSDSERFRLHRIRSFGWLRDPQLREESNRVSPEGLT